MCDCAAVYARAIASARSRMRFLNGSQYQNEIVLISRTRKDRASHGKHCSRLTLERLATESSHAQTPRPPAFQACSPWTPVTEPCALPEPTVYGGSTHGAHPPCAGLCVRSGSWMGTVSTS